MTVWSAARTFETMRAIADSARLSPHVRHLLLTIALYIDNNTGDAQIAVPTLAAKLNLSKRATGRRLNEAQEAGWLSVLVGAGMHRCNRYVITPETSDVRPRRSSKPGRPPSQKTPRAHDAGLPENPPRAASKPPRAHGPHSTKGSAQTPPSPPPARPHNDDAAAQDSPDPDSAAWALATLPPAMAPCLVTRWSSLVDPASGAAMEGASWEGLFCSFSAPLPAFKGEKTHPGWSPANFEPMHRAKENVLNASALVLDYDNNDGSNIPIDRAAEVWGGRAYGMIHTSKRHAPAAPRWRIVLVFSRLVTPEEHARIWTWAADEMKRAGIMLDAKTRDVSRFWYWPCRAEGGHFEARMLKGPPLPVDPLLSWFDRQDADGAATVPPAPAPTPSDPTNLEKYARAALRRACEAVEGAPRGERNNTMAREAYSIGGYVAIGLLDAAEVSRELKAAAGRGGWDRCEESRTKATIERQLRAGAMRPRVVPDRPYPGRGAAGRR